MPFLRRTTSTDPGFQELVTLLDRHLWDVYGDLQAEYQPHNQMGRIDTVLVAEEDGDAVGCACFKRLDTQTAELKRMFVKPEFRGTGLAATIIAEIENWVKSRGCSRIVLETGSKQQAAVHLYQKMGYTVIDNYGPYHGLATSICMEKTLKN